MDIELHDIEPRYEHLRVVRPGQLERLVASLARVGQQEPVLVVPRDAAAGYVLVDGYKRFAALTELGRDVVRASVLKLSEVEALLLAHSLSAASPWSPLERAWLLQELHETHGMSQKDLAVRFRRSVSWVSRSLAMVQVVPDNVTAAVRKGLISPQAVKRYVVPLARANPAECEQLVDALDGERVSLRQMARLYAAWRGANDAGRARIAAHPQLFLRAEAELASDEVPEVSEAWERAAIRDLKMVASICWRTHQFLRGRNERGDAVSCVAPLRSAWTDVRRAFGALTEAMPDVVAHPPD